MEIVKVLEQILYDNRLNQTQFAERIGVKPSQVSEWLAGKNKPGYEKLRAICKEFKLDANVLLSVSNKENEQWRLL